MGQVDGEWHFSELHAISDLHLGGEGAAQVFSGKDELTTFVGSLQERSKERDIALVIGGDFVDFLAEKPASCFDPFGASTKLRRVATSDPTFAPIWRALGTYVATPNRYLVIVLGNHDLELSIPRVQRTLVELLAGADDSARGRVILSMNGHGFSASVSGRRVLCLHGNEVDTWNVVDFEQLRRLGVEHEMGRGGGEWIPNAGTKLVIEVMNEIKRTYPFVDLLKPEIQAVVPILYLLNQGTAPRLAGCLRVGARLAWDKMRRIVGLLGGGEESGRASADADADLGMLLAGWTSSAAGDRRSLADLATAHLRRAEQQRRDGVDPLDLVHQEGMLAGGAVAAWITNQPPEKIAYEAVKKLHEDRSFDPFVRSADDERVDEFAGSGFTYVIAGHTHLERNIERRAGNGRYFNTGTWARLIQLKPGHLDNEGTFAPVWQDLQRSTIGELEQHGLVIKRRTVASVWEENGSVHAKLRRVRIAGGTLVLDPAV